MHVQYQAECYHYLFDAANKLHQLGLDWSSPSHDPLRHINRLWGSSGNFCWEPKVGTLGLDYMIEPSQVSSFPYCFTLQLRVTDLSVSVQRFLLLSIEGTVIPMSFVTDILLPYALDNVGKYVATTYVTEETQHDIDILRSHVRFNAIRKMVLKKNNTICD